MAVTLLNTSATELRYSDHLLQTAFTEQSSLSPTSSSQSEDSPYHRAGKRVGLHFDETEGSTLERLVPGALRSRVILRRKRSRTFLNTTTSASCRDALCRRDLVKIGHYRSWQSVAMRLGQLNAEAHLSKIKVLHPSAHHGITAFAKAAHADSCERRDAAMVKLEKLFPYNPPTPTVV